jgi:HD-GYP domain-containing protein (c-di-GMP phosphodiesterase class II)
MDQYSDRNPYADHLVEVNKHNPVITTQNICNSKGAIVVPEGTRVTEDVANKIARFQLELPIELQVSLASTVSPSELFEAIRKAQGRVLKGLDRPDLTKELIRQCGLIGAYPLVSQKMTVFSERLPGRFNATQSAAGFAVMIAMELGLVDEDLEVIFAAVQMHDAGFLNIDPDIASIFDKLPDTERREMFIHQLFLGGEFLEKVPNLSKRVVRAVQEHKERKDGSGWPRGIVGDQYSLDSQIVGLAVMLDEAYKKKLKPRGYGPSQLLPLVQAESESVDRNVFHATVEMLRKNAYGHSQVVPIEFMPNLSRYLMVQQRFLIHWLELAKDCAMAMRETQDIVQTERSMLIISSLEELYRNSGLWDPEIRSWLSATAIKLEELYDEAEGEELELVALMFEDVLDKMKSLQWSMRDAAKKVGSEWISRCEDLASLLYALPKNHFEAIEVYDCFLKE